MIKLKLYSFHWLHVGSQIDLYIKNSVSAKKKQKRPKEKEVLVNDQSFKIVFQWFRVLCGQLRSQKKKKAPYITFKSFAIHKYKQFPSLRFRLTNISGPPYYSDHQLHDVAGFGLIPFCIVLFRFVTFCFVFMTNSMQLLNWKPQNFILLTTQLVCEFVFSSVSGFVCRSV